MSSTPVDRKRYTPKLNEICVGNISNHTEPNSLLNYFGRFGSIIQCSFTSQTGGYVFITYKDPSMVDACMNSRPHFFDGRHLYVKRALPVDDEHPRERFETTRDLMIVVDFEDKLNDEKNFLSELRHYFSSYGRIYACKYCYEKNFKYTLVEFADKDVVDRIILDKPHYFNEHQLNVMKFIPSNIEIMNRKYECKKQESSSLAKDAIDDDNFDYGKSRNSFNKNNSATKERINESALEKEVFRLQNVLKKMNEDYSIKRRQLEEECIEQLKKNDADAAQTTRLQKDIEEEYKKLLVQYESLKHESEILNDQYLSAELENFEITSYYEQILADEKAKTLQLEKEFDEKLKLFNAKHSSSSSTPVLTSPLSPLRNSSLRSPLIKDD